MPTDVRRETARVMEVLGGDGSYMVCPALYIQPDTLPGNVMALYETALAFRVYGELDDTDRQGNSGVAPRPEP